jgi:hypothetical protein
MLSDRSEHIREVVGATLAEFIEEIKRRKAQVHSHSQFCVRLCAYTFECDSYINLILQTIDCGALIKILIPHCTSDGIMFFFPLQIVNFSHFFLALLIFLIQTFSLSLLSSSSSFCNSSDGYTCLTALNWIQEIITFGKERILPFCAMMLNGILPSISHKSKRISSNISFIFNHYYHRSFTSIDCLLEMMSTQQGTKMLLLIQWVGFSFFVD